MSRLSYNMNSRGGGGVQIDLTKTWSGKYPLKFQPFWFFLCKYRMFENTSPNCLLNWETVIDGKRYLVNSGIKELHIKYVRKVNNMHLVKFFLKQPISIFEIQALKWHQNMTNPLVVFEPEIEFLRKHHWCSCWGRNWRGWGSIAECILTKYE